MKTLTKRFLFFVLCTGLGTGLLFGKGKAEPASLPEGTSIDGVSVTGLSADIVAKLTLTKGEVVYVKQLQLEVERRSKMQEIPPEISPLDLRRMVLDAVISERLVLQAAERAGTTSSNAELEQRIQMVRASAGRQVTDQEFAEGIEKQYGMSYSAFQTYLHEDIVRQKYIEQYIVQQAEKAKAGDSISEKDIDTEIQNVKNELAAQAGRVPTDAEFNDFIKRQGMDLVSLRGQVRRQLMVQKYLISLAGGEPSEEEIQTVYNRYKAQFIRPDTISFNWIQVPLGARQLADSLAKEIGSSTSKFNEKYPLGQLPSSGYKSGVSPYVPLSSPVQQVARQIQQAYGTEFINTALKLNENAVSGVIETPQGFVIIKITEKYGMKNLTLDDIAQLGAPTTVRDMIISQLMQRALSEGAAMMTNTLAEDLRKEGSVEIHENLLFW